MTSKNIWNISKKALNFIYPNHKISYIPHDLLVFITGFLYITKYGCHNKSYVYRISFLNGAVHGDTEVRYMNKDDIRLARSKIPDFTINNDMIPENSVKLVFRYNTKNKDKFGIIMRKISYFNGALHGEYKSYWITRGYVSYNSDYLQRYCFYIKGKLNGYVTEWYPSGIKKYKGLYIKGVPHGKHKQWWNYRSDQVSKLEKVITYNKGHVLSTKYYK